MLGGGPDLSFRSSLSIQADREAVNNADEIGQQIFSIALSHIDHFNVPFGKLQQRFQIARAKPD